ncbi:MAG: MBL fold metallo-hydrolase [Planctomycetota bacterium]
MQSTLRLAAIIVLLMLSRLGLAVERYPIGVRWWGHSMVSIETYWNLTVVIDPYSENLGYPDPNLSADLVLITHEHSDHNNVGLIGGGPLIAHGADAEGRVEPIDHVLDRLPGQKTPTWRDAKLRIARSQHAMRIRSIASSHNESDGSDRGSNAIFVIDVNGVRIVHCGNLDQSTLTEEQLKAIGSVDVLLIAVGGVNTVDGPQAAEIVRQTKPHIVVPIRDRAPDLIHDLQKVQDFVAALDADRQVVHAKGNTFAISAAKRNEAKPQAVVLETTPWEMPEELDKLFQSKEYACQASQQVFAKLSVEQMNFQPSNGTHTPRWNTEHMMGRELGFFSKIYSQIDSQVPHVNLNPQQMPPDYQAAHPNWSGEEEARQMERVSAFTRRFAYLLDGLPLDAKAPGSRWTLRGLLQQMQRHYGEHTANVQKKFELPDWPQD